MMVSNGVSASQGEVITIWVSLSEVVDAKSGYVSAVYDQTILELISASFHFSNNPSISGFIKEEGVFAYVDAVGISGNIVAYQFAIKNSASVGEHDVRISMEIKDGAGNSSFMAATSVVNVAVSLPAESTKETTQVTTQTTTMTTIIETTTVNTTTVSSYPETTAQTTTDESVSAQATTMESTTDIATSSTIAVETSSATSMTIQTETQVMTSLTTDMQSETEAMTSESSSVDESSISSNKLSMDEKNTLIIWLTITCNLIIILVASLIICRIKKKK